MRSRPTALAPLAVGVGLAAIGCAGGSEGSAPTSEVRDSAGVTIVSNAHVTTPIWDVADAPSVTIGTLEGEEAYQLFRVYDATRLEDGRILVANGGSSEVRVFGPDGTHLASWGGDGEGPGEFTSLRRVGTWRADSIFTWDDRQRRISVFAGDGDFGRSFQLPTSDSIGVLSFVSRFVDGSLLASGSSLPGGGAPVGSGTQRMMQGFERLHPDDGTARPVGVFPGAEVYTSVEAGSGGPNLVLMLALPFARGTVAAAWRDLTLVASNERYELRGFDPDGDLRTIVRRAHELVVPTEEHRAAYVADRRARLPNGGAAAGSMFDELPLVPSLPAYGEILVDALDYLWVREYRLLGDERGIWTVFDRDGRIQGTLETPTGLTVYEIGPDYVLGEAEDDLEVEYVQLWPLTR